MTPHENRMETAGVSEAIGFLLIFTMVIVGIGLVTLYGYPMLLQQQTNADQQIMEKNMIVLQNDMKSLAYKTVPYKETSLKIGGGSLAVYNASRTTSSTTSKIRIYDGATTLVDDFEFGQLNYTSIGGQTDICLQNGAVLKRSTIYEGSVMIAEPRWFYDAYTNTMVVNLISINSSEQMAGSGIGTVQMVLGETKYITETRPINDFELEYTPDGGTQDYSLAWDTYFRKFGFIKTGSPGGGKITYGFTMPNTPPPTLVIKQYDIVITSV
jgi:hypothetical protein